MFGRERDAVPSPAYSHLCCTSSYHIGILRQKDVLEHGFTVKAKLKGSVEVGRVSAEGKDDRCVSLGVTVPCGFTRPAARSPL
jgi:hypothetical protein